MNSDCDHKVLQTKMNYNGCDHIEFLKIIHVIMIYIKYSMCL